MLTTELTTDQKGAIAESAIVLVAVEHGLGVSRPVTPLSYDLVLDIAGRLLRVQCKWAQRCGDTLVVRCRRSRRGPEGFIHRGYDADEVDAFAAYCAELRRSYLITTEDVASRSGVMLRVRPTRNNQRALVNWASDFEFGATLRRLMGP